MERELFQYFPFNKVFFEKNHQIPINNIMLLQTRKGKVSMEINKQRERERERERKREENGRLLLIQYIETQIE